MAGNSTFTQTGVKEMKAAIERFPQAHEQRLKGVAVATAARVKSRAQQLLLQQTRGEGNTAAALKVTVDDALKRADVHYGLIRNRPANLPIWLEYGTIHMAARPHMRPAADAERDRYRHDLEAASGQAARDTFGT